PGGEQVAILRQRSGACLGVDDAVHPGAERGVLGLLEPSLHPLQEEQPRAVDELVDHPRGNQFGGVQLHHDQIPIALTWQHNTTVVVRKLSAARHPAVLCCWGKDAGKVATRNAASLCMMNREDTESLVGLRWAGIRAVDGRVFEQDLYRIDGQRRLPE